MNFNVIFIIYVQLQKQQVFQRRIQKHDYAFVQ
jgi:hypothetical protein